MSLEIVLLKRPNVGRTDGSVVPAARVDAVSALQQLSDALVLRFLAEKGLGAFALEAAIIGFRLEPIAGHPRRQLQEALDIGVPAKRLASVVDHPAIERSRRVWQEQRARKCRTGRRDIQFSAIGRTPDDVQLGLDEHVGPFPYSPSDECLAAMARDLLCDVANAVAAYRTLSQSNIDEARRSPLTRHIAAEPQNVGRNAAWSCWHGYRPATLALDCNAAAHAAKGGAA